MATYQMGMDPNISNNKFDYSSFYFEIAANNLQVPFILKGRPVYRDGRWYFEVPTDGSPAYMDETTFYRVRNRRYGWPPYWDPSDQV